LLPSFLLAFSTLVSLTFPVSELSWLFLQSKIRNPCRFPLEKLSPTIRPFFTPYFPFDVFSVKGPLCFRPPNRIYPRSMARHLLLQFSFFGGTSQFCSSGTGHCKKSSPSPPLYPPSPSLSSTRERLSLRVFVRNSRPLLPFVRFPPIFFQGPERVVGPLPSPCLTSCHLDPFISFLNLQVPQTLQRSGYVPQQGWALAPPFPAFFLPLFY